MSRKFFRLRTNTEEPTINLTPLIDVVFVILIMFIVVAPLLELDRIQLASGSHDKQQMTIQERSSITVHVHKDNSIWFNKQKIPVKQLISAFKEAQKRYPHAKPQLFHDREASFGTYQAIKNAAEIAGFEELDIILKPT